MFTNIFIEDVSLGFNTNVPFPLFPQESDHTNCAVLSLAIVVRIVSVSYKGDRLYPT